MKYKNPAKDDGATPLHLAALNDRKGHFEICKLIVENVEDKNPAAKDGSTPRYIAAKRGHFDIHKLILKSMENANKEENPKKKRKLQN